MPQGAGAWLATALRTIYEPPVDDPVLRHLGSSALHTVNAARGRHVELVGLRPSLQELSVVRCEGQNVQPHWHKDHG